VKILHVLDHSIPLHSGYTFRTRAILKQQRSMGWQTEHLTSAKHQLEASREGAVIDGAGKKEQIEEENQEQAAKNRVGEDVEAGVEEVSGLRFFRTRGSCRAWARLPIINQLMIVIGLRRRIVEVAEAVAPDIIHAHSPSLNGLAALWAGRHLGLPVVYECRAFWEDAAVDHGSCKPEGLRYRVTRWLESFVFKHADAVTTICDGLRQEIISRGISAEKVSVIPNAVDAEQFRPTDLGVPEEGQVNKTEKDVRILREQLGLKDKYVLGFIGSFYAYEGIEFLIEALAELVKAEPRVRLLLIGGGPREDMIKKKVAELGLCHEVIMLGRLAHDDIAHYYNLIDLLVYPRLAMRLTNLVTPLKPLEAMAKEVMVMASDVGGHRELIEDGITGRLFHAGDQQDFMRVVLDILHHPDARASYCRQAREYVERERNWSSSVSGYKPIYTALDQA